MDYEKFWQDECRARAAIRKEKLEERDRTTCSGPIAYLIYQFRGQIKVKEGRVGWNFYPTGSIPSHYMTGVPRRYDVVTSKGKILVRNKEDIPEAIAKLQAYYAKRREDIECRGYQANKNVVSIINQKEYAIE